MLYDENKLQDLIENNTSGVDCIIFTFRNNVSSEKNPNMYGWVKIDADNNANYVSVRSIYH